MKSQYKKVELIMNLHSWVLLYIKKPNGGFTKVGSVGKVDIDYTKQYYTKSLQAI